MILKLAGADLLQKLFRKRKSHPSAFLRGDVLKFKFLF